MNFIQSLETMIPNLKACYHERDFIPGKTIIENMVESIQGSQKIVLVLSPDFVQSRWCLLEANLSVFQDCLGRKGKMFSKEHQFPSISGLFAGEVKCQREDWLIYCLLSTPCSLLHPL
uniref:TIR domain-containing protein n=1 Tax=Cairina moschata TaxID=8855 RepID=A0A8C3B7B0_CAIMO